MLNYTAKSSLWEILQITQFLRQENFKKLKKKRNCKKIKGALKDVSNIFYPDIDSNKLHIIMINKKQLKL